LLCPCCYLYWIWPLGILFLCGNVTHGIRCSGRYLADNRSHFLLPPRSLLLSVKDFTTGLPPKLSGLVHLACCSESCSERLACLLTSLLSHLHDRCNSLAMSTTWTDTNANCFQGAALLTLRFIARPNSSALPQRSFVLRQPASPCVKLP